MPHPEIAQLYIIALGPMATNYSYYWPRWINGEAQGVLKQQNDSVQYFKGE